MKRKLTCECGHKLHPTVDMELDHYLKNGLRYYFQCDSCGLHHVFDVLYADMEIDTSFCKQGEPIQDGCDLAHAQKEESL